MMKLKSKGVASGVYYPVPLHLQPAFNYLGYKIGDMPNSEFLSLHTFAIPVYPELNNQELEYIVNVINCI